MLMFNSRITYIQGACRVSSASEVPVKPAAVSSARDQVKLGLLVLLIYGKKLLAKIHRGQTLPSYKFIFDFNSHVGLTIFVKLPQNKNLVSKIGKVGKIR